MRLKRACGSQDGYERLKAAAFAEAARVRGGASPALLRLASLSVVRMERPVAVGRDEALDVTVCRGRLILELPPGSADVFDGDRRLEAEVEYSAQGAADGSGPVYQMKGAEPIVYRLAAVDLRAEPPGPVAAPTEMAAAGEVAPVPSPTPAPTPDARPSPRPIAAPPAPRSVAVARVERPRARPTPKPSPTARAVARKPRPEPTRTRVAVKSSPRPTPTRAAAKASPRPKPTQVAAKPTPRPTPTQVAVRPAPRPTPTRAEARPAPRPTPRATVRPSFPCAAARSRVERLVCEDARLARADRAMSAEFRAALAEADPYARRELYRTRGLFLAYRDRCDSAGCVLQAYADRVEEIRDIAAGE